ncbi:MAG: diguanylate cyclase domain-containing protein [Salipiger marinus]|uniref:diguanylate cyclase domain-containing protein n=1 Tax=Salipiger marinus TaxID=555512 RepID=UPI00405825D9
MTGRILIADGVPTNRIVLRVKLTSAFYDVQQASSGAEALALIRQERPDLVIASAELPDMEAEAFCSALQASAGLADMPLILLQRQTDPQARMAALAAGAEDVLGPQADDSVLLARLRSLLRDAHAEDELRLREDTRRALGLAEAPRAFETPPQVVIVPMGPLRGLAEAACRLRTRLGAVVRVLRPADIRTGLTGQPDVVVIADSGGAGDGLGLLAQLRASPGFRHLGLVYVAAPEARHLAASALDLGANDILADGLDPEELAVRLPRQVARKRTAERLRADMRDGLRAAVTDPLTGLYNRRYALPHLARLEERAVQTRRPYALLLADLDHFKQVNDSYGHAAGDQVLTEVAARLMQNLRAADLVARIGGEEFLIAMPDTGADQARRSAERICALVAAQPVALREAPQGVRVTLSIGLALRTPEATEGPEALLLQADRALYAAKHAGRNCARMAPLAPVPPRCSGGSVAAAGRGA